MKDSVNDAPISVNSVPTAGNATAEDPHATTVHAGKRLYLKLDNSQWVGVPTLSTMALMMNGVQDESEKDNS